MAGKNATSYEEIMDILELKARNNIERKQVLVTTESVKVDLKIHKNKELSRPTIRGYGISQDGYFSKKWPEIFNYQKEGDPKYWGLVMKPEKYLREVRDFSDKEIEKLKPEKQEVEA